MPIYIYGGGGADTSEVTATPSDVLSGEKFIGTTEELEMGTMPNRGAVSETISAKAQIYTIPNGYHSGSGTVQISSTEQAKIIAGNIRKGVSVLGVTGTFPVATAAVEEVLSGKTFVGSNGAVQTGTMTNNGAITQTLSTKSQTYTIPAGYHSGSGKVSIATAEQNKIIASNIKKGASILGVTGTYNQLNYTVVGGTTKPSSPAVNTIWVNTSTNVTAHTFSVEQPYRVSNNKNLNVYPYHNGATLTTNGITFTRATDGKVTVNGTATATAYYRFSYGGVSGGNFFLPAGTYTVSKGNTNTNLRVEVGYSSDNWATSTWAAAAADQATVFTVAKDSEARMNLMVLSGATISNVVVSPQLEAGSTATSYVTGTANGNIWFKTGSSSPVAMSAVLPSTHIKLYPIECRQYISGTWTTKAAQTYMYGAWNIWQAAFFDNGDLASSGGYTLMNSGGVIFTDRLTISNTIKLERVSYSAYGFYSNNAIDVTPYSTLRIDAQIVGTAWTASTMWLDIGLSSNKNWNNFTVKQRITTTDRVTYDLDISSLTGNQYFVCWQIIDGTASESDLYVYSAKLVI